MNPMETTFAFVEAINSGEVEKIVRLLADDHLFIDAGGTECRGRDTMREGWVRYFSMFPDYAIEVQETLCRHQTVLVVGAATATYAPDGVLDPANRWRVPATWRAVVRNERIAVWQVFADMEPINQIIRRYASETA